MPAALVREPARRDEVVVAGDRHRVQLADPSHAFIRVRPVAGEVAQAKVRVDARAAQRRERGLERVEIAVDVGQDAVAQLRDARV